MGAMAARTESVAKYICSRGGWRVSNLQLQKIFYMMQMYYMGQNDGSRLADAAFEAWDYGPVEPELYRRVRMYGASPIEDVFTNARRFNGDDSRLALMAQVCDALLPLSAGQLVAITHWRKGAWAKNYVPGAKGIVIPDNDIASEFSARAEARHVIGR